VLLLLTQPPMSSAGSRDGEGPPDHRVWHWPPSRPSSLLVYKLLVLAPGIVAVRGEWSRRVASRRASPQDVAVSP
jgi:hypothetical protein